MRQVLNCFAFVAISAAAPAVAQPQAQPQPQASQQPQTAKPASPDDVVCEKELDTGSRLSTHKICHTRSQWADLLQQSRSDVERAQAQRAMSGN